MKGAKAQWGCFNPKHRIKKKLPTKQFGWFFFLSFSSLIARNARNFRGAKTWDIFQYAHLFIGVGQIMKIIRNSSYTSDGIFSWSQIYIQYLFLVCCMRFLWVFSSPSFFFFWIYIMYYELRKNIELMFMCLPYAHNTVIL